MNPTVLPQGSRMDEQRCSAPQIFQNMGKDHPTSDADKPPQRSSSLNRAKPRQVRRHAAQYTAYSFIVL